MISLTAVVHRHGDQGRHVRGGDYLKGQQLVQDACHTKGAGVKIFSTFILTRRVHQMVTFPFEGYKKNVTGNIVQLLKTCLLLRSVFSFILFQLLTISPSPFSSSQVNL